MDCIKNILNSMGEGDCATCVCDIFPQVCQEKKEITENLRISDNKEKDTEVEIRSDEGEEIECYYCSPYVHGEFDNLKDFSKNFFIQMHFKLVGTLLDLTRPWLSVSRN